MRLLTFLKQPRDRRRLVAEASIELLRAWWLVRRCSFKSYSHTLGEPHAGLYQMKETPENTKFLRDVRWATEAVNRTAGGRFTCLMQGMAGKAMLNRRGISNSLVLGARLKAEDDMESENGMAAHAWLCVGQIVLLGGEASAGYVPVTSYLSP